MTVSSMNLASGVVLDNRYELLDLLGEGGMGQVFKARHNRLGKIVAVKSLRNLSHDPVEQAKFLEAFESEARILAELDHSALAKVSDFFEMNGIHFLVMEFIDGRTLARVVELAPRNLSQRRVVQWAEELCDVLSYLHRQNPPVIVRDLKPENVMIDSKRRLRLIDFGISKRLRPGEGTHEIVKGMGTAEYAPLEQYGNSTTDQRSDIYALGATLYFLLTEIAPPPAWKRASEGVEPVPPSQVNETVTKPFEQLLLSMMALKREGRPQSIEEVAKALKEMEEDLVLSPESVATVPTVAQSVATPNEVEAVSAPASPASSGMKKGEWASLPVPPDYSSSEPPSKRYGMPGSSLERPKMAVVPKATGRPPEVKVLSCKSLRRYATIPYAVKTCPGRPVLAVAGRFLQLWSLETEQMVHKLWSGEQQVVALDFSPDGRFLYVAEFEGKVRQYEVSTGKKIASLGRRSWGLFPDRNRDLCALFGSHQVAVASDASNIRVFDLNRGEVTKVLDWHQTGLLSKLSRKTVSIATSREGYLAAGGADGSVTVYEKGDFETLCRKSVGRGEIQALEFSSNGEFLAVSDSRGAVHILKSPSFETVQQLPHPSVAKALSFSHDMRVLATGSGDRQIRFFHLNTGKELLKLSHHAGAVLDVHFDGQQPTLVSVGNDRRLYVTKLTW